MNLKRFAPAKHSDFYHNIWHNKYKDFSKKSAQICALFLCAVRQMHAAFQVKMERDLRPILKLVLLIPIRHVFWFE